MFKQCLFYHSILGAACAFLLGACEVEASVITFTPTSTLLTTTSGGTATFDGTVTNNSGVDLNASDFFFNFFGFDAASVNPVQDFALTVDFSIPNGTSSAMMDLFHVTLGLVAPGSSFPIDVVLQDTNSDLSATEIVTVSVPGTTPIPEPATLFLLAIGTIPVTAFRRRPKVPTLGRRVGLNQQPS